jgi:hypothetical protein
VQNAASLEARCHVQLPHGDWKCNAEATFTRGEEWLQVEVLLQAGQTCTITAGDS